MNEEEKKHLNEQLKEIKKGVGANLLVTIAAIVIITGVITFSKK